MIPLLILNLLFNQPKDELIIKDEWLRPNAAGMTTALYFNIENPGEHADTLFKVDFEFAARVEIHETYEKEEMMGMRKVENIIIEAGNSFSLKPGEHHIMLIKLKKDIIDGKQEEFTLHFKKAGKIKITAEVKTQ